MESTKKFENNLEKLIQAYSRLQEVLERDFDDIVRDSAIQRFEFTFELTWKTLKSYLLLQGYNEISPRAIFQKSFQLELVSDLDIILEMMQMRNLSSHSYDEDLANDIYEFIVTKHYHIGDIIKNISSENI